MSNQEFHQRRLSATPRGVGVMCDFFARTAENATLTDVEGNDYIDFAAGIAVLNTGHRHPELVAAVEKQLHQFTHTAYQIVPYESYVSLAEKLNELAPVQSPAKTAFFTTGAEAVENAIKIARAHTGRPGVIAFGGGFHGRTYMTMALTGKVAPYKLGFGPFPGSVYHVPYPSELHGITTQDAITAIERLFKADIEAKQVAAIIFEPIQGEGGFNVAPPELVAAIRRICDEHGIVMIADEVQSGFARTGKLFAMEQYADKPDLMTMAKSRQAECRCPAWWAAPKSWTRRRPAVWGNLCRQPAGGGRRARGAEYYRQRVTVRPRPASGRSTESHPEEIQGTFPALVAIRGRGSMIAAEFFDPESRAPSAAIAQAIQQKALAQGLLLLICGQYGNVIRFLYPLTIPDAQFTQALAILQQVMRDKT